MKKLIYYVFLLVGLLFASCSTPYAQKHYYNPKYIDKYVEADFKNTCSACEDPILLRMEKKVNSDLNSLSIEEQQLYADLKQNCEICMASHRVAYEIYDKPNASSPLWFSIIAGIASSLIIFALL
ncbi:hypothetical protein D9V86_11670 [Bacteroidetes/Chlorobi group bacterium ChocPot_Mid]|nr:MAG: hypothetical protein D9V86_11670 [Bacteroidetes/Chlorobi group bacterium ChocPot_Mid]